MSTAAGGIAFGISTAAAPPFSTMPRLRTERRALLAALLCAAARACEALRRLLVRAGLRQTAWEAAVRNLP